MDANGEKKKNAVMEIGKAHGNPPPLIRVHSRPFAVSCDLPPEPRLGHAPFSFHGPRRNRQDLSDFFVRQTAKEAQLDDLALARIEGKEILERIVKRHQIDAPL
jgi:hypothetical protein